MMLSSLDDARKNN